MMSCLWMCLSLLYLLQHNVSSDQAVSLICPKNLEVSYGETVTVNCSIEFNSNRNCIGTEFIWKYRDGIIECKNASTKYICDWDRRSYVFLNIFDVNNNTSVSVEIGSDCGLDVSPFITVNASGMVVEPDRSYKEETRSNLILGVLAVVATIIVVAILSFLIKNCIARKFTHTGVNQNGTI